MRNVKMRVIRVNLRENGNLSLPLNREKDQTAVNFRDVLQGKMAVGLKSSEGKCPMLNPSATIKGPML